MATSHGGRRKISTTLSGYGHQHQMARRAIAPIVALGETRCCRCGLRIAPGQQWHLDHSDDRRSYIGVSHAACNLAAGARKGNALRAHRLSAEERALRWAAEENAYWARVERERLEAERRAAERPRSRTPRIY